MRRWVFALALTGCGNTEPVPSQPAVGTRPAGSGAALATAPTDAAAQGCTKLTPDEIVPGQVFLRDVVWRSPSQLVVAVSDNPRATDPRKAGPEDSGIALYDLTSAPGVKPTTYRVPAYDIALHDHVVLAVNYDRVSRFEPDTACVRFSEPLEIMHAAIDAVRGRFFVITGNGMLRIDGADLRVAADVPAPKTVKALAYDPTSDRVLVVHFGGAVDLFDGATLAPAGSFSVAVDPSDGPWVRPGNAEAWFVYRVNCMRRKKTRMPSMRAADCLDDPKTIGTFLARHELPSGKLLDTIRYTNGVDTYSEGGASFSGDSKKLIVTSVSSGHVQDIDAKKTTPLKQLSVIKGKPQYTWGGGTSLPSPNALDADGARMAGWSDSYYVRVFETTTGNSLWTGPLPGNNPY